MPQNPRLPRSLNLPRLYAIVDVDACAAAGHPATDVARAFLSAGVRLLQLRCKSGGSGAFLELAHTINTDARQAGAMLVINDRADIAALCTADGLHVGQDDLTPSDARAVVGAGMTGLTTALRLTEMGKRVVVLEARSIGSGTTSGTTAHITEAVDTRYTQIESDFGAEGAKLVAASSRAAIEHIARRVEEYAIACGFERVRGYLYSERETDRDELDEVI